MRCTDTQLVDYVYLLHNFASTCCLIPRNTKPKGLSSCFSLSDSYVRGYRVCRCEERADLVTESYDLVNFQQASTSFLFKLGVFGIKQLSRLYTVYIEMTLISSSLSGTDRGCRGTLSVLLLHWDTNATCGCPVQAVRDRVYALHHRWRWSELVPHLFHYSRALRSLARQ